MMLLLQLFIGFGHLSEGLRRGRPRHEFREDGEGHDEPDQKRECVGDEGGEDRDRGARCHEGGEIDGEMTDGNDNDSHNQSQ